MSTFTKSKTKKWFKIIRKKYVFNPVLEIPWAPYRYDRNLDKIEAFPWNLKKEGFAKNLSINHERKAHSLYRIFKIAKKTKLQMDQEELYKDFPNSSKTRVNAALILGNNTAKAAKFILGLRINLKCDSEEEPQIINVNVEEEIYEPLNLSVDHQTCAQEEEPETISQKNGINPINSSTPNLSSIESSANILKSTNESEESQLLKNFVVKNLNNVPTEQISNVLSNESLTQHSNTADVIDENNSSGISVSIGLENTKNDQKLLSLSQTATTSNIKELTQKRLTNTPETQIPALGTKSKNSSNSKRNNLRNYRKDSRTLLNHENKSFDISDDHIANIHFSSTQDTTNNYTHLTTSTINTKTYEPQKIHDVRKPEVSTNNINKNVVSVICENNLEVITSIDVQIEQEKTEAIRNHSGTHEYLTISETLEPCNSNIKPQVSASNSSKNTLSVICKNNLEANKSTYVQIEQNKSEAGRNNSRPHELITVSDTLEPYNLNIEPHVSANNSNKNTLSVICENNLKANTSTDVRIEQRKTKADRNNSRLHELITISDTLKPYNLNEEPQVSANNSNKNTFSVICENNLKAKTSTDVQINQRKTETGRNNSRPHELLTISDTLEPYNSNVKEQVSANNNHKNTLSVICKNNLEANASTDVRVEQEKTEASRNNSGSHEYLTISETLKPCNSTEVLKVHNKNEIPQCTTNGTNNSYSVISENILSTHKTETQRLHVGEKMLSTKSSSNNTHLTTSINIPKAYRNIESQNIVPTVPIITNTSNSDSVNPNHKAIKTPLDATHTNTPKNTFNQNTCTQMGNLQQDFEKRNCLPTGSYASSCNKGPASKRPASKFQSLQNEQCSKVNQSCKERLPKEGPTKFQNARNSDSSVQPYAPLFPNVPMSASQFQGKVTNRSKKQLKTKGSLKNIGPWLIENHLKQTQKYIDDMSRNLQLRLRDPQVADYVNQNVTSFLDQSLLHLYASMPPQANRSLHKPPANIYNNQQMVPALPAVRLMPTSEQLLGQQTNINLPNFNIPVSPPPLLPLPPPPPPSFPRPPPRPKYLNNPSGNQPWCCYPPNLYPSVNSSSTKVTNYWSKPFRGQPYNLVNTPYIVPASFRDPYYRNNDNLPRVHTDQRVNTINNNLHQNALKHKNIQNNYIPENPKVAEIQNRPTTQAPLNPNIMRQTSETSHGTEYPKEQKSNTQVLPRSSLAVNSFNVSNNVNLSHDAARHSVLTNQRISPLLENIVPVHVPNQSTFSSSVEQTTLSSTLNNSRKDSRDSPLYTEIPKNRKIAQIRYRHPPELTQAPLNTDIMKQTPETSHTNKYPKEQENNMQVLPSSSLAVSNTNLPNNVYLPDDAARRSVIRNQRISPLPENNLPVHASNHLSTCSTSVLHGLPALCDSRKEPRASPAYTDIPKNFNVAQIQYRPSSELAQVPLNPDIMKQIPETSNEMECPKEQESNVQILPNSSLADNNTILSNNVYLPNDAARHSVITNQRMSLLPENNLTLPDPNHLSTGSSGVEQTSMSTTFCDRKMEPKAAPVYTNILKNPKVAQIQYRSISELPQAPLNLDIMIQTSKTAFEVPKEQESYIPVLSSSSLASTNVSNDVYLSNDVKKHNVITNQGIISPPRNNLPVHAPNHLSTSSSSVVQTTMLPTRDSRKEPERTLSVFTDNIKETDTASTDKITESRAFSVSGDHKGIKKRKILIISDESVTQTSSLTFINKDVQNSKKLPASGIEDIKTAQKTFREILKNFQLELESVLVSFIKNNDVAKWSQMIQQGYSNALARIKNLQYYVRNKLQDIQNRHKMPNESEKAQAIVNQNTNSTCYIHKLQRITSTDGQSTSTDILKQNCIEENSRNNNQNKSNQNSSVSVAPQQNTINKSFDPNIPEHSRNVTSFSVIQDLQNDTLHVSNFSEAEPKETTSHNNLRSRESNKRKRLAVQSTDTPDADGENSLPPPKRIKLLITKKNNKYTVKRL